MKHRHLEKLGIYEYPDNGYNCYKHYKWYELSSIIKVFFRNLKYKIRKHKNGVDSRDSWSLDTAFYQWLYEHLCQYVEDSEEYVELTYHKFIYKDKEYNQLELINLLKNITADVLLFDGANGLEEEDEEKRKEIFEKNVKSYEILRREICDIWFLLLPCMWN